MTLPTSGQITTTDIANEFGYSQGSTNGIRISDYRGQDFTNPNNTTVRVSASENVSTSGEIKFSNFYGGRLTIVVNYFGAAAEIKPGDAYQRFTFPNLRAVVGGFKQFTGNNSAGTRVVILVNEDIGSDKVANTSCALRTGTGWDPDTVLEVLVGPDGEILGAGGEGGIGGPGDPNGAGNGYGTGAGTSGLGIQFEGVGGTKVTIQSGGRIAGGGGGGGGGGGARVTRSESFGNPKRGAPGAGGGGGAGFPSGGANQGVNSPGTAGTRTTGGAGGAELTASGGNFFAVGGSGGNGGGLGASGITGEDGSGYAYPGTSIVNNIFGEGGAGGAAGAAIRRIGGMNNIIIENLGASSQIAGSTVETGVT